MSESYFFNTFHLSLLCYGHLTHKKILYKVDSPKQFFSSAISVAATRNTCFVSKQEVPSDHGRTPDSAPLGILMYFCNSSCVTGLTNPGNKSILAKEAKNAMKNHILKPLTFTLIMLSSKQTVEISQKLTVFFK